MKNKSFLMLSVAALLALGACGGKTPSNNKSSEPDQPSVDPYHYEDPEVNLVDAETPNMEIDFDEIAETCMTHPNVKTYIDQMEAQEKEGQNRPGDGGLLRRGADSGHIPDLPQMGWRG